MTRTGRRLGVLACAACAIGAAGCARRATIASVVETSGAVDRSDNGDDWVAARTGEGLGVGDALRTGPRAMARLQLVHGGVIRLAENGRMRFQRGGMPHVDGEKPALAIELGSAEIEDVTEEVAVMTAFGPARVGRGTRLRLRADGQNAALEVLVGRAEVLRPDGQMTVEAGQGVRIQIGGATVERFRVAVGDAVVETAPVIEPLPPPPQAAAPAPVPVPVPVPASPVPADEAPTQRDDEHADVTLVAGESAVVHDRKPSLSVRLRIDQLCGHGGVVETGAGRRARKLAGVAAVVLRLSSGAQRYRIRCAGDAADAPPRATGMLSLKRDSGNAPLSKRPPSNVIDADGRRYTVLFQTRPPAMTLAWPKAPAGASGLTLNVESLSVKQVFPVSEARHKLPSGALPEGTYTWWFASDGGVSPRTTITIQFDNAAPTAQFFQVAAAPGDGPAGAVPIDGVTLEGAKVSAAGQPLPLDGRGRFHAAVAPLTGDQAVAVRLEHPRTGVHYYVRRASYRAAR